MFSFYQQNNWISESGFRRCDRRQYVEWFMRRSCKRRSHVQIYFRTSRLNVRHRLNLMAQPYVSWILFILNKRVGTIKQRIIWRYRITTVLLRNRRKSCRQTCRLRKSNYSLSVGNHDNRKFRTRFFRKACHDIWQTRGSYAKSVKIWTGFGLFYESSKYYWYQPYKKSGINIRHL